MTRTASMFSFADMETRGQDAAGWLAAHAGSLIDTGQVRSVLAIADSLPDAHHDFNLCAALAYARLVVGDWPAARVAFAALDIPPGDIDPGPAWRIGLCEYLRGEYDAAERMFARGRLDGSNPADEAILMAWQASTRWLRGDHPRARVLADRAEQLARAGNEARALSVSLSVQAMLSAAAGDRFRMDACHLAAVDAADQAGDVCVRIRLRTNRAGHLTAQGFPVAALAEIEVAFELIARHGYVLCRAMALNNQGDAYAALGRYEEAVDSYLAARDDFQAMGSRAVAYPLAGMGLIHRMRGEIARARAVFEQAIQLAERVCDAQGLCAALAGLARVRAADDLALASQLADEAAAIGDGPRHIDALLAQGWVAAVRGDQNVALQRAAEAAADARHRQDASGLAESLELAACVDAPSANQDLSDARDLWRSVGNPLGVARVELLAATWASDRTDMQRAATALRELGVRLPWSGVADLLAQVRVARARIEIHALGLFRVTRQDRVVPTTEWQSKKARDLLKILVSRRGRPITRDEVINLLWPEDDSAKASNRLSVLMSTLRSVFTGPSGRGDPDALIADRCTLRLDLDVIVVDVEVFCERAAQALSAWEEREANALQQLERAEAAYAGEFCEEDVYDDWAQPMREELRAVHLSVLRALCVAAREAGLIDRALRALLMILRHDPYDESAHLDLVAMLHEAGRYGDARRHFATYTVRMSEIAVEPSPFPGH